jgi:hypothetical protein
MIIEIESEIVNETLVIHGRDNRQSTHPCVVGFGKREGDCKEHPNHE